MSGVDQKRPIPDDFVQMRAKLGGYGKLAKHYHANWKTVKRWLNEAQLPALKSIPPTSTRAMPPDFPAMAPTMTQTSLCRHYKAGRDIVTRWLAEAGVAAKPYVAPYRYFGGPSAPRTLPERSYSHEDAAADILRHYYPVYRCDARGRGDFTGKFWRVGNSVVDGDELIERSERKRRAA